MRTTLLISAALAGAATLAAAAPAEARQGCGPGFHRGYHDRCVPNRAGPGYRQPVLVVGNFYRGQGYWDGRRYWQHRYRYNNGWRYR